MQNARPVVANITGVHITYDATDFPADAAVAVQVSANNAATTKA